MVSHSTLLAFFNCISHVCVFVTDGGIIPSSVTRTAWASGSRRGSIASRHSAQLGSRSSGMFRRQTGSQVDLLQSPSSGVFAVESEDEGDAGPSGRLGRSYQHGGLPPPRRKESRRHSRTTPAAAVRSPDGYFAHHDSGEYFTSPRGDEFESTSVSPVRQATALSRIASYIGFSRQEHGDEEAGLDGRRQSHSHDRSRRGSSASGHGSLQRSRSRSPSTSEEDWGYGDEDDADSYATDGEEGEEGYSSSLADDTSLPPQSRPHSPNMPLVPSATDGIFGEPGTRAYDLNEPKDFVSTAVPSRQTVLLPDEDLSIRFTCYRTDPFRNALWWAGCIITFGVLGLFGRWVPKVWVNFCGKETAFDEAKEGSWLVVEVSH